MWQFLKMKIPASHSKDIREKTLFFTVENKLIYFKRHVLGFHSQKSRKHLTCKGTNTVSSHLGNMLVGKVSVSSALPLPAHLPLKTSL